MQYADEDARGARHYRTSLDRLRLCVADLEQRDLAFTIQLGDLIDAGPESLDRVLAVFDELGGERRHVLGNHDFALPRADVLRKLSLPRGYYDFAVEGWRFVVLDTVDISPSGGWPPDGVRAVEASAWLARLREGKQKNAYAWNGGIGERQLDWLRATLADAEARGQRVVLFGHLPLLPDASSEAHVLWNHEAVLAVLEACPAVVAYFCGHDHAGGYALRNGIHHVTVQGMVEAPRDNAYAIVEVHDDRLELHGIGRVPTRTLPLRE